MPLVRQFLLILLILLITGSARAQMAWSLANGYFPKTLWAIQLQSAGRAGFPHGGGAPARPSSVNPIKSPKVFPEWAP